LQAITLFARREHEVGLLARERPDRLLGQQVHGHAQRGQRRAEFVRDGGDQIVAQLLEPAQPGHVLQHDRRGRDVAFLGVQRRGARQQRALTVGAGDLDRLFEALGDVRAVAPRDVLA
jgi:hypothetical protein